MAVTITPTEIPEVVEIQTPVFGDDRGFFAEIFNTETWSEAGFTPTFAQDNVSCSMAGALRGLHYQLAPHSQGKLVRVLQGAVFDVAVDIREGSPTLGQWVGRTLTGRGGTALWVPEGFAHGFQSLEDQTLVLYKCTRCYAPQAERSIRYDDPAIAIAWPQPPKQVSDKDAKAPLFADADRNFVYSPSTT